MERPWNRTVIRSKPRWALLVREQLVAATTLVRAAMAGGTATRPRFVVQSLGRSGSTLLTDLLAAHPQIECDGEILSHRLWITTPERLVRDRARLFPSKCYGFKMRPRHYDDQHIADPAAFLKALHDEGWHVVHLERRNLFRIALSWVANEQTKVVHRTMRDHSVRQRQHVPIAMLRRQLTRVAHDVAVEQQALSGVPHHRMVYEDDLLAADTRQASMDRLFEMFGLPPSPVATKLVRLTSDRLEDFVENHDEVRQGLRGTEWEKYL